MKNSSLILALCVVCTWAQAQPYAPDFTITDSNSQSHQLYADYLDQGKTVVLKFFFTYCPPCNAIAPLMEPLYQDWGGGMYDMEMISLSIRFNDYNQDVADYKQMHGHTWPGAGADGGAPDAVQPYIDGMFGTFLSTPTFAVIAPDGNVIFNPKGADFEGTLDSLEVAILSTGAQKPFAPYTNSGHIQDIDGASIANVNVGIATVDSTLALSNADGDFSLDTIINIFETNPVVCDKQDASNNGINLLDVLRIQQHILAVQPLEAPYQRLAADIDHNGAINLLDLLEILKVILSVDSALEHEPTWVFLDTNYEFENPDQPALEVFQQGKGQPIIDPDNLDVFQIIGIKLGDVDVSADAN